MEQDQASPIATMAGLRSSCFSDSLKAVWYFSAWSWAHTWPIQISGRVNAKKLDIQTFSDNSSLDWEADPYQYLLATSDYQWVDMQVDEQCLFWWNIWINFSLIDDFIHFASFTRTSKQSWSRTWTPFFVTADMTIYYFKKYFLRELKCLWV